MSRIIHRLLGCRPTPLAHYLKALGVLRLLAEQRDSSARGAWRNDVWILMSSLKRDEIDHFFLYEYSPTPLLSPWNKGSGFYQEEDKGLHPIESSTALRLESFRAGVRDARDLLPNIVDADTAVRRIKDESNALKSAAEKERLRNDPDYKRRLAEAEKRFKSFKEGLIPTCRRTWRGAHLQWLEAAVTLTENGESQYPALLGTGGNDGRLDFTNNFMQRLGDLFDLEHPEAPPRACTASLLQAALWSEPSPSLQKGAAIGQFLPGGAGGANSTNGPSGDSLINPWDFILMLEGAVLFTALATRHLSTTDPVQASAPFALRGQATGYAGANPGEESPRGEQWMPLWERPMTLGELKRLLGEARAQIGSRPAQRPLDAARAIGLLGVARGLSGFQRFGYLERNGQSNLAVPLGRIEVLARPRARLIDDLAVWLDRLNQVRSREKTARLDLAERSLSDAVFAALTHEDQPGRWQGILLAAAQIELLQTTGSAVTAGPIPRLSPGWLAAADDGSPEFRLALSLGSAANLRDGSRPLPAERVRHHFLPLDDNGSSYALSDKRLRQDPRVVCHGRNAVTDCIELVLRRLIEASGQRSRSLSLVACAGMEAQLADLADLIAGRVNLEHTLLLARALMAVKWWEVPGANLRLTRPSKDVLPDDAWSALRLCLVPWPLRGERRIPADAQLVRRLASGDATGALHLALRHLRSAGLVPTLMVGAADPVRARLWGAALAFPCSRATATRLLRQLDPTSGPPE